MPHLVFVAGPNAGRRYKLGEGDYVIGRRSDCQIFVPDMRVSRQHARLRRENGSWQLEDLGSNNGTFVNGARVQQALIKHQDEIQIANNRIRVEMPDHPSERLLAEVPQVTIVEVHNSAVWTAQPEAAMLRPPPSGRFLSTTTHERHIRLVERKLDALTSILEVTASATEPDQILAKMVDALLDLFPQAESVGVLVEDERSRELKVQCQRHRRGFVSQLKVPATIVSHIIADRRGVLLGSADTPSPDGDAIGSRMGAPLVYAGTSYGAVYVEAALDGKGSGSGQTSLVDKEFRQEDVDLLGSVAVHTALAIHATRIQAQLAQRERLERDLRVARQIQRSLLPAQPPTVVGLDFAIHYEPAYQIGGDFYDFIWHDQAHLAMAVGDVAGKAISAALYMARLTSELRSRAGLARTPARLLRRVNTEMVKIGDDGMFATLVYCIYDLESRSLIFTNAGHCVPLLRRGDRVFPLHADRAHIAPIGVMPELEAGEARVQLHTGDMLILVSDGILEARDTRGFEYGLNRLSRRVRTARGSAEDVIKAILQDIDSHTATGAQGDDMTILAMAIDERRAKRKTTTIPGIVGEANGQRVATPPAATPRLGTEDDTTG